MYRSSYDRDDDRWGNRNQNEDRWGRNNQDSSRGMCGHGQVGHGCNDRYGSSNTGTYGSSGNRDRSYGGDYSSRGDTGYGRSYGGYEQYSRGGDSGRQGGYGGSGNQGYGGSSNWDSGRGYGGQNQQHGNWETRFDSGRGGSSYDRGYGGSSSYDRGYGGGSYEQGSRGGYNQSSRDWDTGRGNYGQGGSYNRDNQGYGYSGSSRNWCLETDLPQQKVLGGLMATGSIAAAYLTTVHIRQVNGLAPGKNSLPDPFVTLECEGRHARTPVMRDSTDPVFNETAIFYRKSLQSPIKLQVINQNLVKDVVLGECNVPAEELTAGQQRQYQVPLAPAQGIVVLDVATYDDLSAV